MKTMLFLPQELELSVLVSIRNIHEIFRMKGAKYELSFGPITGVFTVENTSVDIDNPETGVATLKLRGSY